MICIQRVIAKIKLKYMLKLVIECCFRVGNEKYTKENKSYGVSTLLNEHVRITNENVI